MLKVKYALLGYVADIGNRQLGGFSNVLEQASACIILRIALLIPKW